MANPSYQYNQFKGISIERKSTFSFDIITTLITVALVIMGAISIYSATVAPGMKVYFDRQIIFAGVGFALMVLVAYLPQRIIQSSSYIFYAASILLLVGVIVMGKEVNGQKNWLALGPLTFQPSEFAKLSTIMAVAVYLAQRGIRITTFRDFSIVSMIVALPTALILIEDFGTASVFLVIYFGILLWSGFDLYMLFYVACLPILAILSFFDDTIFYAFAAIMSVGLFLFRRNLWITIVLVVSFFSINLASDTIYSFLQPHQKSRIETFLNPDKDPRGKGYNVIQSIMAVGSGGLTGKGFMQGSQTQLKYIPKQWTDFIFCVPAEEFGFAGGITVIGLLTLLVVRGITIASKAQTLDTNRFASLVAAGISMMFFYHMLVNIGMAIGLFPVMGIPLPFMSAGGTSLVINLLMVGVLLNIYRTAIQKSTSKEYIPTD
jgi:rod shape determining protein RodA